MGVSQDTDDLARQTQAQEWDTPTGAVFVSYHSSTTQISFKCFQSCQTKVTFAEKITHYGTYLVLNTFHMLNFVWLGVQLCYEGGQSTSPLSPDACKQIFSSEDEPLAPVNSETFVWQDGGNLQYLFLSSNLQIVQIFCVLNLFAISHRTHH